MKNSAILIFFLITIILSFITLNKATAQWFPDEPCKPDCDTSEWVPNYPNEASSESIILPCGSVVRVKYRTRHACDTWFDLYIESVIFSTPYDGWICGHTMSIVEMMEAIMEIMIIQNPMNFPPTVEGDCRSNWRVMKGACWFSDFEILKEPGGENHTLPKGGDHILPNAALFHCHYMTCCLDRFEVCIQNNQKVITHLSTEPGDCPNLLTPFPPPFDDFDCINVCD